MDLNELLILKRNKETDLLQYRNTGETELRELNSDELVAFNSLKEEIRKIDEQIEAKNKTPKNINTERKMNTEFKDLLVRNGEAIENFKVRAVTLSTSIDNQIVSGNISDQGYTPFYKQLGAEIMPNLISSIKLPFVNGMVAGKVGEGGSFNNPQTLATVLLQPSRYTITETIGKEILAVGNESALQAYLMKLAKAADRAVTQDVFNVLYAGASGITAVTGYTVANMNSLLATVDGNAKLLMPFAEFWKAKGTAVGTAGLYLAVRDNEYSGHLNDGTPLFYSQLFTGSTANTIICADLEGVTIGEFGSEYEVIFDIYSKAPQGQVVITVVKLAGVVLRNALSARKMVVN